LNGDGSESAQVSMEHSMNKQLFVSAPRPKVIADGEFLQIIKETDGKHNKMAW